MFHTIHHTFDDGRNETSIDRTTDDGVDNNQLTTPLEIDLLLVFYGNLILLVTEFIGLLNGLTILIRFYDQVNLTELTGTTGLFLVTIVSARSLSDGLAIWNLRLLKNDRHLIVVLQTPLERTKVELTLTADDHLAQFFRLLYDPCRVFLMHTR